MIYAKCSDLGWSFGALCLQCSFVCSFVRCVKFAICYSVDNQGLVVQSIISLMNSLAVVAGIFKYWYIDIYAAKNVMQKLLTFFSKNINVYAIFQDRNFDVTLANNFGKFWTTGPRMTLVIFHFRTSQIPDIRFYRYFLRSGLWAWWAKLAYQVMLTIRGRLITPFILGVRVCWSEHSDSSFVYRFMSLDYGLGTMTASTFNTCN